MSSQDKKVDVNNVESGLSTDGEYSVDKIVDKRLRNNKIEYLIKWNGYKDSDSTWEPQEHLNCDDLVEQFEKELKKKENVTTKKKQFKRKRNSTESNSSVTGCASSEAGPSRKSNICRKIYLPPLPQPKIKFVKADESENFNLTKNYDKTNVSEKTDNDISKTTPVELKVEQIMGVSKVNGELIMLIKWEGVDEPELIPANKANKICPQMVIKYYMSKTKWEN